MNLKKKSSFLKNTFDVMFSQKGIGIIVFVLTLITLSLLLSSRFYLFQSIIKDGLSKKDIIASRTINVVDSEKTNQIKKEIELKIAPVFTPTQDEFIKENFSRLLGSVDTIRKSSTTFEVKQREVKTLLGISEKDLQNNSTINYILKTSDESFKIIQDESIYVLDKVLEKGLTQSDINNNIDSIVKNKITHSASRNQTSAIFLLIKQTIVPNMVIDELATEIARKNATSAIKPIVKTFEKGEKIVFKGEPVTKLKKDALKEAGLNVFEFSLLGLLGIFTITGLSLFCFVYYLINYEQAFLTPSYISLMAILAIFAVSFSVFLPQEIPVYIIPFSAIAILMAIFTNPRIAMILSSLVVTTIALALQYDIEALAVFLIGIMIAIFTVSKINLSKRIDLIKTGFEISIVQVLAVFAIYLLQVSGSAFSQNIEIFTLNGTLVFINGLLSGVIALGTLPLIESTFKIITPFGLAELADHNQALLKRLQFEAPGTYHHSLMVGNLAEAASEAVGGNPTLARVGAFYHDIGKLKRPLFFIENQSYFGIENPHEKLNPRLSKMVITAHPKDGIELAKEYKLPTIIHQFITQHHGDGMASYFYNEALKQEGKENITEEQFRYNCQKPTSKETAILMIADAVESAVRSLKNPTQAEIDGMIEKIIKGRLDDKQLSESPLTLKDLKTIAETFSRVLRGMQHHRIKYHENVLEELETKSKSKLQMPPKAKEQNGQEKKDKQGE